MPKTALITSITGQDGSHLAELLLEKGYVVHGLMRRTSTFNMERIERLYQDPHDPSARLVLHYGDLTDRSRLVTLLESIRPGATPPPQNEETQLHPRSPYGVATLHSHWMTRNYREVHGMFAVNGILFNHESPRRGQTFVTRKIAAAAARSAAGKHEYLYLGNLDAIRDWGYAPEYVEAMWRMLQADVATDFVVATGVAYSVRDLVQVCFEAVRRNWEKLVRFNECYLRPREVDPLIEDPSKAREQLGWTPNAPTPHVAGLCGRFRDNCIVTVSIAMREGRLKT